jgi:hypothetical protein
LRPLQPPEVRVSTVSLALMCITCRGKGRQQLKSAEIMKDDTTPVNKQWTVWAPPSWWVLNQTCVGKAEGKLLQQWGRLSDAVRATWPGGVTHHRAIYTGKCDTPFLAEPGRKCLFITRDRSSWVFTSFQQVATGA